MCWELAFGSEGLEVGEPDHIHALRLCKYYEYVLPLRLSTASLGFFKKQQHAKCDLDPDFNVSSLSHSFWISVFIYTTLILKIVSRRFIVYLYQGAIVKLWGGDNWEKLTRKTKFDM